MTLYPLRHTTEQCLQIPFAKSPVSNQFATLKDNNM
jgi:hypothetical protein